MIRAYLDTNLYSSYLLDPFGAGPPTAILDAGLELRFTMVFGKPTVIEILHKISTKLYLTTRIPREEADEFLWLLYQVGEHVTTEQSRIPAICRDRKDDYLLAYSAIAQADYLVSGDHDLLALGEFDGVRIVSPAAFAAILDHPD